MIEALSKETIPVANESLANDTQRFKSIIRSEVLLQGGEINIADAGTPARFLLALCTLQPGVEYLLKGTERMHQRPMKELVEGLRVLGAQIECLENDGFLPMRIKGCALRSAELTVDGKISSQFISALSLIAPYLPQGLTLRWPEQPVSFPYIQMTWKVQEYFGVQPMPIENGVAFLPGVYKARPIRIENDWSSACFFYAAKMLQPSLEIQIADLNYPSWQGDSIMASLGSSMGVETQLHDDSIELITVPVPDTLKCIDFTTCPDLAIPILVAMAFRLPSWTATGIHHLAFKESNRIQALQTELLTCGMELRYINGMVSFHYVHELPDKVKLHSYQDHRLVMSFSLLLLLGISVEFDNTECVHKSFPNFWEELEKLNRQQTK
jgi:3-phosphoshikimate 1-carboxyvinyltransferase